MPENTTPTLPPSNAQRVKRYLLYAIGEILLVVVGILIAVQINNLNEQSKRLKSELFILNEIADNLQQDGNQLATILAQREKTQKAIVRMNGYLSNPAGINPDTFSYDLAQLLTFERYFPIRTSYEVAKVNGLPLSNKELRSMIAQYYEYEQNVMQTSLQDIEASFLNRFTAIPSEFYFITAYGERVELKDHTNPVFLASIREVLSFFIPNHTGTLGKLRSFHATNERMTTSVREALKHRKQ